MLRYALRKLLGMLLVAWGIVTLLFLLFNLLGDPARVLASQRTDPATLAALRHEHGLDQPRWKQYFLYLNDLSPIGLLDSARQASGDYAYIGIGPREGTALALKLPYLRKSFASRRPVAEMIFERLPATTILAAASLLLAAVFGVGMGLWAGTRLGSGADRVLSVVAMLGISAPSFLAAVLLLWLLAVEWHDWTGLPVSGYVRQPNIFSDGYAWHWERLLLPALTLGIRPMAVLFQLARDSMAGVLREDFIRTARAKGLRERGVRWKHALRNALNPVATAFSGWLASLLAGAFFVEYIFDWPGIGKLTIDALFNNDYPLLLGTTLTTGLLFAIVNLGMDLLYPVLDPRVARA